MSRYFGFLLSFLLAGATCLAGPLSFGDQSDRKPPQRQGPARPASGKPEQEKPKAEPPRPEQIEKQTPRQPQEGEAQRAAPAEPQEETSKPEVEKPVEPQQSEPATVEPQAQTEPSEPEPQPPAPPATDAQSQEQSPAEAAPVQPSDKPVEPQPQNKEAKGVQNRIAEEIEKLADFFSLRKIVFALLTLVFFYLAHKALVLLLNRIAGRRKDQTLWLRRAIPFVSFGLWFLAVAAVVSIFADSSAGIIVLLVLAVLALIFASQQLLRDIIGGMVILFERPFQIGDRIKIGDHQGEVVRIGPRAFQLLSPDGSVVAIPNADVARLPVSNSNPGAIESHVITELLLPDYIDIEDGRRIAYEAAAISPYVYINRPIEVQVDEEYAGQLLTRIIVKAYVFDAQYERELRSDTIERARKGFQRHANLYSSDRQTPV